ncbi:MAG: thioredoxin [Clostridia bacterium]|nr:thioredoxin [Clostridia bacterium]
MIKYPNKEEFNEIIKNNSLVLVDFYASWCMPCKMLAPVIEEIAEEYDGKVVVCKVDIDENEELANEYNIMSVPTVVIFKKSENIEEIIGLNDKSKYTRSLE